MPAEASILPRTEQVSPISREAGTDPCDPVLTRVRGRIAAGRQALGFEPELLDAVCGFREGTIARLEAGKSRIGPAHLYRLALVCRVGIDWFFADAEPRPAPMNDRSRAQACEAGADARRFLALYARLRDGRVRDQIRMLVRAIAQGACDNPGASLPLISGELSPDW